MGIKKIINVDQEKIKANIKQDLKNIDKKDKKLESVIKRLEIIEKILRI